MTDCVFCAIVAGREPATVPHETSNSLVVVPLCPVVEGHVLVLPRVHVAHAATDPRVTALTMLDAAQWAATLGRAFNVITLAGAAATQSVSHLHLHVIPRAVDDGLMIPWGTLHGQDPALAPDDAPKRP